MSTYVDKAVNPKTGKSQLALFFDDFYGTNRTFLCRCYFVTVFN